jgi:hypothetical protein
MLRLFLRGDDHRLEGKAVCKGIVRYHCQRGGQGQTGQLGVIYNNTIQES